MNDEPTSPVSEDAPLLAAAKERFQQAYDAHKEDFEECEKVQDFIAGDQWLPALKAAREAAERPCLTLDHLSQYVRHVVNSGILRERDVRVMAMSGEADDKVAEVLAGLIRQITQTSTAQVAYETGLRHTCTVGFGYWRVKVQTVPGTPLQEIVIRKIKEPRMVLFDPFCDYPDGRDAKFCFVLSKLTEHEFKQQYPKAEGAQSWNGIHENMVLPWVKEGAVVVAEYYYYEGATLKWAICTPDQVLESGVHHGNVIPIIRVVGEEYEVRGKSRWRGLISPSAMDAQRAYNYATNASIESVALAPLAPWVAATGQVEQYEQEWAQAHRIPRAVLRYDPVTKQGQVLPPPTRMPPPGIPDGWQSILNSLINDTQQIMGVSQPNVLGTGGMPVQSGVGIEAQQDPGDVNTAHFIEHWHNAIEQTGRVILAMIPHVYTEEQAVKIVGDDGMLQTAVLNPNLPVPVQQEMGQSRMGYQKILSTSYNHLIGRYDVAISTGPASATKKAQAAQMMTAMVQSYPALMDKAGDLVFASLDMAGADVVSKRLKAFLPPGVSDDDEAALMQQLQQFGQENQALKQQVQEMQQVILAEREKSQASLVEAEMKHKADLVKAQHEGHLRLVEQQLGAEGDFRLAAMKANADLEKSTQDNIVKLIIAKLQATNKLDLEASKQLAQLGHKQGFDERIDGYSQVLEKLNIEPSPSEVPPPEPKHEKAESHPPVVVNIGEQPSKKKSRKAIRITRPDGSQSVAELLDLDEPHDQAATA